MSPIYEYECPRCNCMFERRMTFAESDEPQECPNCGIAVQKNAVPSSPAVAVFNAGDFSRRTNLGGRR